MTVPSHPVVGILGGMGPDATLELMRRVLAATPANCDEDHIHLIVDNNPKVPSRVAAIIEKTGIDPAPELIRMAKGLQGAGATMLAMPCNTAHAYAEQIAASVKIPLLNMIELTAAQLAAKNLKLRRVGMLASRAVQMMALYEKALAPQDITLVYPGRQDEVMGLISAVKKGNKGEATRAAFTRIAHELMAGSDILLIACTELSVLAESVTGIDKLDALDVLTQEIVARALAA